MAFHYSCIGRDNFLMEFPYLYVSLIFSLFILQPIDNCNYDIHVFFIPDQWTMSLNDEE